MGLDKSAVTDAGLRSLSHLTRLRTLSLPGTKITDAGLEHLKRLPNLTDLFLPSTELTKAAVDELRAAMPKCHIRHYEPPATASGK